MKRQAIKMRCVSLLLATSLLTVSAVFGQNPGLDYPEHETAYHSVGNIEVGICNYGRFCTRHLDFEGNTLESKYCIFPKGTHLNYLFRGEIWIGGIIGRDTLVSAGERGSDLTIGIVGEWNPEAGENGLIEYRSILSLSPYRHVEARSEQDYICHYCDTAVGYDFIADDALDDRPHMPMNICVRQSSYAWSFDYAEDFVLYDFLVTNIGDNPIKEMFTGIFAEGGRWHEMDGVMWGNIVGFKRDVPSAEGSCRERDTLNIGWLSSRAGYPSEYGEWTYKSLRSVIGIQPLRPDFNETAYNYNWWVLTGATADETWGPRRSPTNYDPWREIGMGLGWPVGDRNRYYLLSHPEFDYDQLFSAISHVSEGFLPPPPVDIAAQIAAGWPSAMFVFSFGPYDLMPGDSMPFSFALIGGENFHVNPLDFETYFNPHIPWVYYDMLDFSDLAENSRWARMVYDNPGVDTDGDGNRGEFCWTFIWRPDPENPSESVVVDSFRNFYTGDGIPDFRAMTPPPPPEVRTYPQMGKVTLRWNGQESETTPDIFSDQVDFEGYSVYMARDHRLTDFVLVASYDIDDFIVYRFDTESRLWRRISNSAAHDSLKALYGPDFDANDYYDEYHYFIEPTTREIMYFAHQGWNQSDLSDPLKIHKVYPEALQYDSTDYTEEGYRRYYEYEYTIDNLQPSVPHYFAVTAFDYGSFKYDIGRLETSPTTNAVREFALPSSDTVEHKGFNVIVYPNPYRIDGGYARAGYENRDRSRSAERARLIHFANLPPICTIRIYTIDGDLVREIKHWNPGGGPASQHEEWNVISRNTQAITTGIYIWSVRSDMGEQLGKLVIIK